MGNTRPCTGDKGAARSGGAGLGRRGTSPVEQVTRTAVEGTHEISRRRVEGATRSTCCHHSTERVTGAVGRPRLPPWQRRTGSSAASMADGEYGTVTDVRIPPQGGRRREPHYIVPVEDAPKRLAHGYKFVVPSARSDPNQIYVGFMPESKFTEDDVLNYFSQYGIVSNVRIPLQGRRMYGFVSFQNPGTILITFDPRSKFTASDAWNYFRHYGPVKDVRIPPQKKRMFGYVSFKTLAREGAHSNPVPQEVSDVTIVECHTGEQLASDHELFENKLNKGCDQEIVTENSSTNVAPVMVSPPKHNLSVHLVSEASPSRGDNTTESSHVSNRLDEASADQDSDHLSLPESLDDVY
nr:unnamed protein product [Digitaria exilis]